MTPVRKRSDRISTSVLAFVSLMCVAGLNPLVLQAQEVEEGAARVALQIIDLTPRFLTFYEAAEAEAADAEQRWKLWKEHYNFAALPPVPERDSLARSMLDEAWDRYPEYMDRIRAGVAGMQPAPEPLLRKVAAHFGLEEPLQVELLVYVGALEGNAFFAPQGGRLLVAIPIEEEAEERTRVLVHEFTHAVHHRLAGLSEGWERSIARTLFAEGLAVHATRALLPGEEDAAYIEARPGWFAEAAAREREILRGIRPYLRDSSSEQVMRFTMGAGTTGIEREAYYAGWRVIGHLLESGHTFEQLARVPEDEIPVVVERAIDALLAAHGAR